MFGAWVPGEYWAHLVNQKLRNKAKLVTPGRILLALWRSNALDWLFVSDFDTEKFGTVQQISLTERRINKKAHFFLCVQSVAVKAPVLSTNDNERQAFFIQQLQKYSNRIPKLTVITNLPVTTKPPAQVTPDTVGTVTPSTSEDKCNLDDDPSWQVVQKLFDGICDTKQLTRLFKTVDNVALFHNRVHVMASAENLSKWEAHYLTFGQVKEY